MFYKKNLKFQFVWQQHLTFPQSIFKALRPWKTATFLYHAHIMLLCMIALSPAFVAHFYWPVANEPNYLLLTTSSLVPLTFPAFYCPSQLKYGVAAIKLKMIFFLQIFHELYQLKNWYRGLWDLQVIVFLFQFTFHTVSQVSTFYLLLIIWLARDLEGL